MKLSECKMGVVVAVNPDNFLADELGIGHVVGLMKNSQGSPEVIPLVLFAGRTDPIGFHYNNLDLFTAY